MTHSKTKISFQDSNADKLNTVMNNEQNEILVNNTEIITLKWTHKLTTHLTHECGMHMLNIRRIFFMFTNETIK